MKKQLKTLKKQTGVTLVELSVGLAIIAGVAAVALSAYSVTSGALAVNANVSSLTTMLGSTRSIYGSDGHGCTGLTNAVARSAGLVPDRMVGAGADDILHENGGALTITCVPLNTNDNFGISMLAADMDGQAECSKFVASAESMYDTIQVGSTDVKAFGGVLDRAALATACAVAGDVDVTMIAGVRG